MKKIFIAASLMIASLGASAQDEGFTSKNGHQVLPEEGNWGLSINAVPLLQFVGNTFNGTSGNTASSNPSITPFALGSGATTVTARKMKDASTAYRVRLGVNLYSTNSKESVASTTVANAYVTNEVKTKASNFYISAGLEKRKGSHRVQGIYGAELVVAVVANANTKYTYGNALTAGSRTTEQKVGNTLYVGPRGFVGVDYFIAPKVSLGAEFGYGIYFSKTAKGSTTTENFGAATTTTTTAGAGGAGVATTRFTTDNLAGAINLNFFF